MRKPQAKKRTKKVVVPLPEGFPAVGSLVRYYSEGWRTGTLDSTKGNTAFIRPIAGFKAAQPNRVKVALSDVEIPKRE